MAAQIELPIKNFPAQQTIFTDKARFVVIAKGRRFGFTKGAANHTIRMFLEGKYNKGLWVDTINGNIERYVERYFIPVLRKLPEHMWKWRKQQKILEIGKGYMDFRSADNPENIEGFGYDYVILNEAGIILKNEYLWNNAIKPMLWDYGAKTYIGGAPKGKGVFFELAQRGKDPAQPDYSFYTFTSFDNPYVQHSIIMDDIKTMPQRVVDQEVYAKFLDDTGIVFRGVAEICTQGTVEPIEGHSYVIGCDIAKLQDFTVLAVYERSTLKQVAQLRFNQLEYPVVKERITMMSAKYNRALVYLDSTGVGEPIFDDLARAGVPIEPIRFTNELKKQLIQKLANYIELKHIKMLQLDETINELTSFTYDISEKTGRFIYGAPPGFHDDIVMAHALAIWGLQPLSTSTKAAEMTPIQRDLHDKKEQYLKEQDEIYSQGEFEY